MSGRERVLIWMLVGLVVSTSSFLVLSQWVERRAAEGRGRARAAIQEFVAPSRWIEETGDQFCSDYRCFEAPDGAPRTGDQLTRGVEALGFEVERQPSIPGMETGLWMTATSGAARIELRVLRLPDIDRLDPKRAKTPDITKVMMFVEEPR